MELPCKQKMFVAIGAGGAMQYFGYDKTFPKLPEWVHYALAGVGVDFLCRGRDIVNGWNELMRNASYAAASGVVLKFLMSGSMPRLM